MSVRGVLAALLCFAAPALAEFRRISIDYSGQECASCSATLTRVIQKLRGVSSVTVESQTPVVNVELMPDNRVPLSEVRDAIKRVGFAPGEARVAVRGQTGEDGGKRVLHPHGLDQVLELRDTPPAANGNLWIEGVIPAARPGVRDTLIARTTRSE
jgi:copper chaperone CopZ